MGILDERLKVYTDTLVKRYPKLKKVVDDITEAYMVLEECYENGGKLLVAGNGGSAADAEHIAGELMKRFRHSRPVPDEFAHKLMDADRKRG